MSDKKLPAGQPMPIRITGVQEGVYSEDDEKEYQEYLDGLSDLAVEMAKKIKKADDSPSR